MAGKQQTRGRRQPAKTTPPARPPATEHLEEFDVDPDREFTVADLAPAGVREHFSADEIARARTSVREWERVERQVQGRRAHLVRDARARGVSWFGVGWLIGTTGEAARQRYGAT